MGQTSAWKANVSFSSAMTAIAAAFTVGFCKLEKSPNVNAGCPPGIYKGLGLGHPRPKWHARPSVGLCQPCLPCAQRLLQAWITVDEPGMESDPDRSWVERLLVFILLGGMTVLHTAWVFFFPSVLNERSEASLPACTDISSAPMLCLSTQWAHPATRTDACQYQPYRERDR